MPPSRSREFCSVSRSHNSLGVLLCTSKKRRSIQLRGHRCSGPCGCPSSRSSFTRRDTRADVLCFTASFVAPAANPTSASSNYVGKSNSTLQNGPTVPGKAFDRIIQIWLENTDYETAASSPVFQNLTKQGLLLSGYHGNTHPSEPNYAVAGMGDFFGMHDDAFYAFPKNTSSIADLLEAKNISWASYQVCDASRQATVHIVR